jgi:hypothetical protein
MLKKKTLFSLLVLFSLCLAIVIPASATATATWGTTSTVGLINTFTDAGTDARGISPGTFGSEYPRMLKLSNGNWLASINIYDNNGYTHDVNGGTNMQVFKSTDNARTWTLLATIGG